MLENEKEEKREGCDWTTLKELSGTDLTEGYADLLRTLGKAEGLLGDIFAGALSRLHNPVNLKKLIGVMTRPSGPDLTST